MEGDEVIKLTDEILMAYTDGELDTSDTEKIEKAIATDSVARRKVEMFRESKVMLQGVYDAPLQERVPQQLIDTILQSKVEESTPGLLERLAAFMQIPTRWQSAFALVALFCIIIGTGSGYFANHIMQGEQKDHGLALIDKELGRGLELTESGHFFALDNEKTLIMPVTTFFDKANRYCRQYDVVTGPVNTTITSKGIACRNQNGEWLTIAHVSSHPLPSPTDPDSGYVPADGGELLETITAQIMAEPPMSLKRESDLIRRKWSDISD